MHRPKRIFNARQKGHWERRRRLRFMLAKILHYSVKRIKSVVEAQRYKLRRYRCTLAVLEI
ncbi:hypothetical protein IEQ34_012026 [Dendrobium chrysotoxum]|uniref:Ribosomal protein L20 n=1 Tax=Dendrobium chrysotoxum TaxID=161865 RepID=A0AAV7GUI1_DENCH|nr:hypothetical protein IEQ34_012026 [Dendrobium chrysotoxum]